MAAEKSVPFRNMDRAYATAEYEHNHDVFFFQAEDGIRDLYVTGVQTVCSSDLALVVAHGLHDLLLRVHHERTVAGDGLGDRDAGEQQQPARTRRAAKAHGVARAEKRELTVANLLALVPDEHRALEHVRHRLLLARKRDGDIGARFDRPVLIDDGNVRVDQGMRAQGLA